MVLVCIFQLWIVCFFYIQARLAEPFDLQLPDIRLLRSCNISQIYQLGASFSDTGNCVVENPIVTSSRLPFGESTFLGPTGRYSDGLLMIDYIALAAGIPFLSPYLKDNANFTYGVNFAVAGATALSTMALAEKNIMLDSTNSSLGIQLEWMSDHLTSQCDSDMHCSPGSLNNSLFMVGEIGRNDYNFAFQQGKTLEEARIMVPEVIEIIKNAVGRVVDLGARKVIVPGIFPIGCFPAYIINNNNRSAYDELHCLKEFNDLVASHNEYLQQAIVTLQEKNPHTKIVYADYYNAYKWLLYNAPQLGFDATTTLEGCCGNHGPSKIDGCGSTKVTVCSNPNRYISWDGMHFTQKAHDVLATWVVADMILKLDCAVQAKDI